MNHTLLFANKTIKVNLLYDKKEMGKIEYILKGYTY